jgi:pimeloyl-ACP methyl ester carboxylesterase
MLSLLTALALAAPSAESALQMFYSNDSAWLCRPGRIDPCAADQTVTVIEADGTTRVEPFVADAERPFDCFYVYPTDSLDRSPNSDLNPGEEERRVAFAQAARFARHCRVYAPLYRQVTLTALRDAMLGKPVAIDRATALADVTAAWTQYLAQDNGGRGVVLIGHSQGASVLKALLAQIENEPVRDRIVSALLLGTNLAVPEGQVVGGDLKRMPVCTRPGEYGCVVTYVSFRGETAPPANTRFGKVPGAGMRAACVSPAALLGHPAASDAIFTTRGAGLGARPMTEWVKGQGLPTTPFVRVPGLISTRCVSNGGADYLAVTTNARPADPRVDDVHGDVVVDGAVLPEWGLHLIDMPVAMGDLVALSQAQYIAWQAAHPAK